MTHQDLSLDIQGDIAIVRLTRPAKRNALNDGLILALRNTFESLPDTVRAAVIDGEGPHFCAGLDLSEISERDAGGGLRHSRMWHAALELVQHGPVPVVAALHGAVVGATSAWPMPAPSTRCPKARAASSWAAAARCASRA
jgi:(methylthio)acryloyl-CoA hydratase